MTNSIKNFVFRRLDEGADIETIWREAEALFPFKCVGWNYVRNLKRAWEQKPRAVLDKS